MNRDFYFSGLFFSRTLSHCGFIPESYFFSDWYVMPYLSSFVLWSIVLIGTALVGSLCMLRYFSYQAYKVAFLTGVIAVLAGFCQNILSWAHALLMLPQLSSYHVPANICSLGAGFLFGISLIFSKAGKNPYLKAMGIYKLIVGGFGVYLMSLWLAAPSHLSPHTITQVSQWFMLASSLEPVPLILLFYVHRRASKATPEASSTDKFSRLLAQLRPLALLLLVLFGLMLGNQTYWSTHLSAATKALAKDFELRTYVSSRGDSLQYLLMKPVDYDPEKNYPVVVCLHAGT